jgi:alpha/beta superfamily hydrolase
VSVSPAEEPLTFGASPRRLDGRLALSAAPYAGAVVCHPHPLYGGTMDNPVVVAVTAALGRAGFATLRFDFGGVGRSEGTHGGGPDEARDVQAAASALLGRLPAGASLVLVGYSFGSVAALHAAATMRGVQHVVAVGPPTAFGDWAFLRTLDVPVTVVVGDRDQYCDVPAVGALRAGMPVHVIRGADHFFAGREAEIGAAVVAAVA